MDISSILSEKDVLLCVEADSKRQLFEQVAEIFAKSERLDENKVFEALWERENLGPTGYGDGIAVPHARIDGLKRVVALFLRLNKGIDFEAYDGKNVDLAAVILSPEQSGEDHLQALAAFSRVLKSGSACQKIRQSKTAHEIYTILNQ